MKSTLARIATLSGLILGAFAVSAVAATWTPPPSAPPTGNPDAPVNVGSATQTKLGWLGVRGLIATDFTLATGTPAAGKVLTAIDSLGNATWVTPTVGASVFDFALAGQSQTIAYGASKSTITVSNAGSARAAIVNFYTSTCNDLNIEIYKTNDTKVARLGGHTGGGSDVRDVGFTTIIPLSSGQFKIQDARASFSCDDVKMVLIGLIN